MTPPLSGPSGADLQADQVDDPPASRLSADHPGVNELFAVLAYGEVAAFYRLTDEARMAPDLRGRISMASMAAAEMQHYELLRDALERRGVDVVSAMA
ncbi:ferritin-like fold-containing protein, partial [Mycobacterium sp. E796]|uniref:ferritin-like fold-containing protein n=1 Tax=Mycobacterium sp. E796 TaxID=1834151 RepID=UPI000B1172DE